MPWRLRRPSNPAGIAPGRLGTCTAAGLPTDAGARGLRYPRPFPGKGDSMRMLLKWVLRLIVLVFVLGAAVFVHVWYFKPFSIDAFYGRVFGQFALQSPEMLSNMRILPSWADFYSARLDDASPAHDAAMVEMIRNDVDVLHRYDRNALDRDGQLSYDVLDYF